MKRYQLIGRKKKLDRIKTPKYNVLHLHSMPLEILLQIFNYLASDISQLINVSLVCRKFHLIIVKNYLYKHVKFTDMRQFAKFTQVHFNNRSFGINEVSAYVNLVQNVEFVNPPQLSSQNYKTKIAGSYAVDALQGKGLVMTFSEFELSLELLLKEDFNLKTIAISEISPQFQFHDLQAETFVLRKFRRSTSRKLDKLIIKAQSGWSILFKVNHISKILEVFDTIEELELHNFIIDGSKLVALKLPKEVNISRINLNSCSFTNRSQKGSLCPLFKKTTSLGLVNLDSPQDLSVIDLVKYNNGLSSLSLDMSSKLFYENGEFNFKGFNPFFKLVSSKQGYFSHLNRLTLENMDVLYFYSHKHDNEEVPEEEFLNLVATIPHLVLRVKNAARSTCMSCGHTKNANLSKDLSSWDWKTLFWKLIQNKSRFEVISDKGKLLFANRITN